MPAYHACRYVMPTGDITQEGSTVFAFLLHLVLNVSLKEQEDMPHPIPGYPIEALVESSAAAQGP